MRWAQLEGDAELLSEYGRRLGLPAGWEFVDVPTLEMSVLEAILGADVLQTAVRAIVVVAPTGLLERLPTVAPDAGKTPPAVFIKQTIGNACGAMALLHVLCNVSGGDASEIATLLCRADTAQERALLIEQDQPLAQVHAEMAGMGATELPELDQDTDLHFVAIVSRDSTPVLLDGRRAGPTCLSVSDQDGAGLVEASLRALQQAIAEEGESLGVAQVAVFALLAPPGQP